MHCVGSGFRHRDDLIWTLDNCYGEVIHAVCDKALA